jgi:endonuclease-3
MLVRLWAHLVAAPLLRVRAGGSIPALRKQQRAALILQRLEELYPTTPIPLDHCDAFTLLVAVLLSAQCTDKKVNEVTPALFNAGGNPAAMAALAEETILGLIRQLGLARTKAKNVKRLAELLLERHGGEVPASFEALEALPGVGHKTASVVMAQAFGVPAFPVDTHIHRLAQRWGLSSGESVTRTETDLKRLFPRQAWNKLHLQMIFYGREHCSARGCDGSVCGLCRELFPQRRRPVPTRKA